MKKTLRIRWGWVVIFVVSVLAVMAVTAFAGEYRGDINDDDRIDLTDVQLILSHAIGNLTLPVDFRSDLNWDSQVNVQDAVELSGWLPEVTITNPRDGASILIGDTITLTGSANSEYYDITEYQWRSSTSGNLGSGASITVSIHQPGEHTITLTAMDAALSASSTSVDIIVQQDGNTLPDLSITWPPDGGVFQSDHPIVMSGSGEDSEDGPISPAQLTWVSDLDGTLGKGTPFTVTGLVPGTHTIYLQGTDDHGLTGQTDVQITVEDSGSPEVLSAISISPETFSPASNPYQPAGDVATTIAYTLTQSSSVEIWVTDTTGNAIRSLVQSTQPSGSHSVLWDGQDQSGSPVPTGDYRVYVRVWDGKTPWERMATVTIFY